MDKKLTDLEIVKALECCARPLPHCYCDECPAGANGGCAIKTENIIDLINRQKEEKEVLEARIGIYETCNARKDEAIKHLESEVKRLQAENERLKSKLEPQGFEEADPMDFCGVLCDFAEGLIEKSKAEAYKEFWEELKRRNTMDERIVSVATGDNLLKEMAGSNDKL